MLALLVWFGSLKEHWRKVMVELRACSLCEEKKPFGTSRLCEIGVVCKECYPLYKKIKDKLKECFNKSLKRQLGEIEL